MGEILFLKKKQFRENEMKPQVIQIGAVGNDFGEPHTSGVMEVLHSQKLLEKEFEKDGIAVIWSFLVGTGPAINEGLANGTVDFGSYGDICGILARAKGVGSVALASGGRGSNVYIAVRPQDTQIKSFLDLKGKRIGFREGTHFHLILERLMDRQGLSAKDFKFFNLGRGEGTTALLAGQIDAFVGSAQFLFLEQQGLVRIVYDSRREDRFFKGGGVLVGREDFVRRYPGIVRRVVKAYVKAAYWASHEKNRDDFLELNTMKGTSYPALEMDYEWDLLKSRNNPLLDVFFYRYYTETIGFARKRGLIEKTFETKEWVQDEFMEAALKDADLKGFWESGLKKSQSEEVRYWNRKSTKLRKKAVT